MDPSSIASSPLIQLGFAGLCLILLAIIVWLIRQLLQVIERNNQVISQMTEVIRDVDEHIHANGRVMDDLRDRLLARPCIRRER